MDHDKFEEFVRSSIDQVEEAYDPLQWESLSGKLDQQKTGGSNTIAKVATIAAVVTVSVLTILFSLPPQSSPEQAVVTKPEVIAQPEQKAPVKPEISQTTDIQDSKTTEHPVSADTRPISETQLAPTTVKAPTKPKPVVNEELVNVIETEVTEPATELIEAPATSDNKVPEIAPDPDPEPAAAFLPGLNIMAPATVCKGENITLSVNREYASTANYVWTINGEELYGPTVNYPALQAGAVKVSLAASKSGQSKEQDYKIEVFDTPAADFKSNQDMDNLEGLMVSFKANAEAGQSVFWDFGDGTIATGPEVSHIFKSSRFYPVTATIINSSGCESKKVTYVEVVKTAPLGEQNTLSPNFDGSNETFMPPRLAELNLPFEMTILDATGKQVYRTTEITKPWNGRINNTGEILPVGFYKWNVVLDLENGQRGVVDGVVRLMK